MSSKYSDWKMKSVVGCFVLFEQNFSRVPFSLSLDSVRGIDIYIRVRGER